MDFYKLKDEIVNDPIGIGYNAMSDFDVAAAMSVENRIVIEDHYINARSALSALGATAAANFLDALDALTATNSPVKWAMKYITREEGINVGDPETRGMLDQLVVAGVLDAVTVASIKASAEKTVSRAVELGLGLVREGEVITARSL